MAQQRQVSTFETDIVNEVGTEMKEKQLEEKIKKLDQRLENVLNKYIDFEQKYGTEDYRTVMMRSILEVSVVMKDMIDTLMGAKEAFQYLFEAMDIVDDTFNIFQQGLMNSTKTNYGFFARLKQRRQMKKAITNNVNRMKQISNMMIGMTEMSSSMVIALKGATAKIGKKMRKGQKGGDGTSSSVDNMIAKAKQERGIDTTTTTTTTGGDTTPPTTGGNSSISDIDGL